MEIIRKSTPMPVPGGILSLVRKFASSAATSPAAVPMHCAAKRAKGPLDHGKRFDACTRWYVAWNHRYVSTAASCTLLKVMVSVEGTITLPRRVDSDAAPGSLVGE